MSEFIQINETAVLAVSSSPSTATATAASLGPATQSHPDSQTNIERIVRFDDECVLIPESPVGASRRPRMVTKSYSLPLWRRKHTSLGSDAELDAHLEDGRDVQHVMLKVPLPVFRSPSKRRSPSTERPPQPHPLSPCLVRRDPSSSPVRQPHTHSHPTMRRPSLPLPPRPDLVTIPLRACCLACVPTTEEALREGTHWQVKFTRAAWRMRSASLDGGGGVSGSTGNGGVKDSFSAISAHDRDPDAGPGPGGFHSHAGLMINVDEVDKRRKSQEFAEERWPGFKGGKHADTGRAHTSRGASGGIDAGADTGAGPNANARPLPNPRGGSSASAGASTTTGLAVSRKDIQKSPTPIEEEDEDQLFPLPSPRRSPNSTPSLRCSPVPSPSGSTACLAVPASRSRESLGRASGDPTTPADVGRSHPGTGTGRCEKGLLTPDASPSLPHYVSSALRELAIARAAESDNGSGSGFGSEYAPSPPPLTSSRVTAKSAPVSVPSSVPVSAPPPTLPPSPTTPSTSPKRHHRASLSIPGAGMFLRAGVDVLKGVAAISGGAQS